jgi:hypothetical protein
MFARVRRFSPLLVLLPAAALDAACSADGPDERTGAVASAAVVSTDLVISEVYGGGGNAGATYTHDFVELFNRGTVAVTLNGKSLQYASASGQFQNTQNLVTLPNVMLQPGRTFLVQLATSGAVGVALPAADQVTAGAQAVNLSATAGKVALVTTLLDGCGTQGTPCTSGAWIDFVGYGAASQAEGTATGAPSNTTSAQRAGSGCVDTGNNATDFAVGTPSPRNGAAAAVVCGDGGAPPPTDAGTDAGSATDSGPRADSGARPDSGSGGDSGARPDGGASSGGDSGTGRPPPASGVPDASSTEELGPDITSSACAAGAGGASTSPAGLALGAAALTLAVARRRRRR